MPWQIETILLIVVGGAQIFLRSFSLRVARVVYWMSVVLSFVWAGYLSWAQYIEWKASDLSRLLLPPHEGVTYFIQYVGWRYFSPAIAVFIISLIFILAAGALNRKGEERFFRKDEIYIAAVAFVGAGYPRLFVFFVSFLIVFLLASLLTTFLRGKSERTSPYYLWIPAALIAILISELWLSHMPWWSQLII